MRFKTISSHFTRHRCGTFRVDWFSLVDRLQDARAIVLLTRNMFVPDAAMVNEFALKSSSLELDELPIVLEFVLEGILHAVDELRRQNRGCRCHVIITVLKLHTQ